MRDLRGLLIHGIPKTFHRVWLGGAEPQWLARLAGTWSDRHPDWELVEWTDDNVATLFPLINQSLFDRAPAIAPNHVGQLRSDILRLEILQRLGGVYVDSDFECLRSIDDLVAGEECFFAWEVQDRWVNNAIVGAMPEHPFISRLIFGLEARVAANLGSKPNKLSGPRYVTATYRAAPDGVKVFDQQLFYPYGFDELHRSGEQFDAYAVHHWHNKRRERGVPIKEAR